MAVGIDYTHLDATSALDFAIGLEEDEQLRYREFALAVRDEVTARFFRELSAGEAQHRRRLASRRDLLVRHGPPRFDTSPEEDEGDHRRPRRLSVRRALEISARAEGKVIEFYSAVLPTIEDAELRACLAEVRGQAQEHRRAIEVRLQLLGHP